MGNGLLGWIGCRVCEGRVIVCFDSNANLLMSFRNRMEARRLQTTPVIQEGEAVTNSNSWI